MEEIQYEIVPNIITGKDLDYLSDMFEWNYGALKKVNDFMGKVNDQEIKDIMQKAYNVFDSNINVVLSILGEGDSHE